MPSWESKNGSQMTLPLQEDSQMFLLSPRKFEEVVLTACTNYTGQPEGCEDAEAFLEWLTGAANRAAEYPGRLQIQDPSSGSWSEARALSPAQHDLGACSFHCLAAQNPTARHLRHLN